MDNLWAKVVKIERTDLARGINARSLIVLSVQGNMMRRQDYRSNARAMGPEILTITAIIIHRIP